MQLQIVLTKSQVYLINVLPVHNTSIYSARATTTNMQIFVRGCAKLLAINVENDDTVSDIYEYVAQESGCAVNDLLLSFHGTPLNNSEQQMEELDLLPGATVDISTKILGGKTHGGLNRVGKVKASTPKVPPQEKQKKKTGRARRREQYAQRFTNKVATPNGIRVGPNSNYHPDQSAQRPLNGLLS